MSINKLNLFELSGESRMEKYKGLKSKISSYYKYDMMNIHVEFFFYIKKVISLPFPLTYLSDCHLKLLFDYI